MSGVLRDRSREDNTLESPESGSTPDKSCRLRRSTQHFVEVYSQESGILKSFWDVDSSAARPGRAVLANSQTGQCLAGSIVATADWCFRSYRAARGSADRRSRPAHS